MSYSMACIHCKEYEPAMAQIIGAQMLAHLHGEKYVARPFQFCPWCGNELIKVVLDGEEGQTG